MRFIHGKPLVHYTLDAAENCNLINLIYVSSDNTKLLNYAKENFNVQNILRNEITSNDNATANAVVQHFLKNPKKYEDISNICLIYLQPTSPLRNSNHINDAIKLFEKSNFKPVTSVKKKFLSKK